MKTYIKILSSFFLLFVINVANTEELTDIKITTPVMDNALIKNEAIESINTKNALSSVISGRGISTLISNNT